MPVYADPISDFLKVAKTHPGPISASIHLPANQPGPSPTIVIGCLMHGNEVGSLPGVLEFIKTLLSERNLNASWFFFLGNPKAARLGQRFTEQDLNRVFNKGAPDSFETSRANEIKTLLDRADLFFDFHQTIEPTQKAFYSFAFDPNLVAWARILGGSTTCVTRPAGAGFASGQAGRATSAPMGGTDYLVEKGVPALTLELSQLGYRPEAMDRTLEVLSNLKLFLDKKIAISDLDQVSSLALTRPPLDFYTRTASQPFTDPSMQLNPGLTNFHPVTKGEVVGHTHATSLRALETGYLLFPKYPPRDSAGRVVEPRPSDLYNLIQKIKEPAEL